MRLARFVIVAAAICSLDLARAQPQAVNIGQAMWSNTQSAAATQPQRRQHERQWSRIRFRGGPLRTTVSVDSWANSLVVTPDRITIHLDDGQELSVASDTVKRLGYAREEFRHTVVAGDLSPYGGFVMPGRGAFGKSGAHLISIDFLDTLGKSATVLLEVRKQDYLKILTVLADITRLSVVAIEQDRKYLGTVRSTPIESYPDRVLPDVPQWSVRHLSSHRGRITEVAFSPDRQTLASASVDRTIRFWDVMSGQEIGNPLDSKDPASGLAFSLDGRALFSWHRGENVIRSWSVSERKEVGQFAADFRLWKVTFSPDMKFAAAVGTGSSPGDQLVIVNLDSLRAVAPSRRIGGYVVTFSRRGDLVLDGGGRNLFRTHTGEQLAQFGWARFADLLIGEEGQQGIYVRDSGRHIERVDLQKGTVTATSDPLAAQLSPLTPRSVFIRSDHQVIAVAGRDRTMLLWDVMTLKPLGSVLIGRQISDVAFYQHAAVVTASAEHVTIWSVTTQQPLGQCLTGLPPFGEKFDVRVWTGPAIRTIVASDYNHPVITLCTEP